mgnify:FL=1
MLKNIKFRKFVRVILAFFSTCFLVLMGWILVDCFTAKSTATEKVITYKLEDNIDYEVTLKDNQFYTSEESNEKNKYVTSLMDTLQVYFDYELSGSKFFDSEYGYSVFLELVSNNDGEVVWKYEEELLPYDSKLLNDVMEVSIRDTVIVDIRNLYDKAMEFKSLTGYDVKLNLEVKIDNSLTVSGYENKVTDEQVLSLSVPLTKKVVSITATNDKSINRSVLTHYEVDEKFNIYLFIVSGLLTLSLLPLTIMSYVSLFNLINLEDYSRKLFILKRKYAPFIKEVDKKPEFKNKEIIDVLTCGELARLCMEKEKLHINLYEDKENYETLFYVIDEKIVYVYLLELNYDRIDMKDKSKVIKLKKKDDSKKS